MYINWEGGNKTVFDDGWHDCICRKSERVSKITLIDDYSKVVGYKANIQKLVAFIHTSNEQVRFEIKNTISFTLASSNIKYLDINLTKYVQTCI